MEFTKKHEDLIQATHDAVMRKIDKIDEHHVTLYGNGKPGIVADFLTFKTQIKTALYLLTGVFTVVCAIIRWWK